MTFSGPSWKGPQLNWKLFFLCLDRDALRLRLTSLFTSLPALQLTRLDFKVKGEQCSRTSVSEENVPEQLQRTYLKHVNRRGCAGTELTGKRFEDILEQERENILER